MFWAAAVVGWIPIAFGVWTLVQRSGATRPAEFAAWFFGLALAHDLVFAPLVAGLAVLLGPRVPPRLRGPIVVGAVVSGALVLVALPPILGDRPADNASLLPRDYGAGLLMAFAVTWAAVAVGTWVRARRDRRRGDR